MLDNIQYYLQETEATYYATIHYHTRAMAREDYILLKLLLWSDY